MTNKLTLLATALLATAIGCASKESSDRGSNPSKNDQGEPSSKDIEWFITGLEQLDPPPGQPNDTHFRVELKGTAAEALWNAMKVPAKLDECLGVESKWIGDMHCYEQEEEPYEGKYRCEFGVNIKEGRVEGVTPC